jgi:hypothetical protein
MKSILGSLFMLSILAFAYGGLRFYTSRQAAAAAPRESTTTANVYLHNGANGKSSDDVLRCDYSFFVNGTPYRGHGFCPTQDAKGSAEGALMDLTVGLQGLTATVYYDPNDPTINSLTDFSAKVGSDSVKAKFSIGVGVVLLLIAGLGAVFAGGPSKQSVAIVQAEDAVLLPDEANSARRESSAEDSL